MSLAAEARLSFLRTLLQFSKSRSRTLNPGETKRNRASVWQWVLLSQFVRNLRSSSCWPNVQIPSLAPWEPDVWVPTQQAPCTGQGGITRNPSRVSAENIRACAVVVGSCGPNLSSRPLSKQRRWRDFLRVPDSETKSKALAGALDVQTQALLAFESSSNSPCPARSWHLAPAVPRYQGSQKPLATRLQRGLYIGTYAWRSSSSQRL